MMRARVTSRLKWDRVVYEPGAELDLLEDVIPPDLRHVLERIADHPINRIDELLPWAVADQIDPDAQRVQDLALAA